MREIEGRNELGLVLPDAVTVGQVTEFRQIALALRQLTLQEEEPCRLKVDRSYSGLCHLVTLSGAAPHRMPTPDVSH